VNEQFHPFVQQQGRLGNPTNKWWRAADRLVMRKQLHAEMNFLCRCAQKDSSDRAKVM